MTITDQQLSTLEAMEKSATEAPWGTETKDAYGVEYGEPIRVVAGEKSVAYHGSPSCFLRKQDAALIAAMRNALPSLIAEVRASREAVTRAELSRDVVKHAWAHCQDERDAMREALRVAEASLEEINGHLYEKADAARCRDMADTALAEIRKAKGD